MKIHTLPIGVLKPAGILILVLAMICSVTACGTAWVQDARTSERSGETSGSTEMEGHDAEDSANTSAPEASESTREDALSEDDFTYTQMNETMRTISAVNVWALPSVSGYLLGALNAGEEVTVTGQCNETGWYRIVYKGGTGYVSDKSLEHVTSGESESGVRDSGLTFGEHSGTRAYLLAAARPESSEAAIPISY